MSDSCRYLAVEDDHRIAYFRHRVGSPSLQRASVVFCGGFHSDMTGIKARALAQWCAQWRCEFVRFDYFGHGQSSGDFDAGTIGRWRSDAIAVLDQLTTGPVVLVGSSMGAWIMLLAALARPRRIAGLVGIASAVDFTERLIAPQLTAAQKLDLSRHGVCYRPGKYDDEPYPIANDLLLESHAHLLLSLPDLIPLHCPLRLIHGMADADVPYTLSIELVERYQGTDVQLHLVKDGAHRLSRSNDLMLIRSQLEPLINATGAADA